MMSAASKAQRPLGDSNNNNNNGGSVLLLKGIIPPLITPLLDQDTIDQQGTRQLLEHVVGGGVSGVFILGSTGEGPSLSYQLRRDFIQLCCEIVNGRVPVLVGVSDTSFMETVNLAKFAAQQAGVSAVVLTSPYYYYPCSQKDLIRYITHVVEQLTDDSYIPVILYNIPALTKVWFEIDTVRELIAKIDQIVGIKDSSGDLDYFSKLCALKQQVRPHSWTVLIGPDHLTVPAVKLLGADGGVPAGANFEPGLFVALYQAATTAAATTTTATTATTTAATTDKKGHDNANDADEELSRLEKRLDILQEVYQVAADTPWFVATKCACSFHKLICHDIPAEPFSSLSAQEKAKVQSILDRLRVSNDTMTT